MLVHLRYNWRHQLLGTRRAGQAVQLVRNCNAGEAGEDGRLDIAFDRADDKRVLDRFVEPADLAGAARADLFACWRVAARGVRVRDLLPY
jgi:hypothetical protein